MNIIIFKTLPCKKIIIKIPLALIALFLLINFGCSSSKNTKIENAWKIKGEIIKDEQNNEKFIMQTEEIYPSPGKTKPIIKNISIIFTDKTQFTESDGSGIGANIEKPFLKKGMKVVISAEYIKTYNIYIAENILIDKK